MVHARKRAVRFREFDPAAQVMKEVTLASIDRHGNAQESVECDTETEPMDLPEAGGTGPQAVGE